MAIPKKAHDSWDENDGPSGCYGHVENGKSIKIELEKQVVPVGEPHPGRLNSIDVLTTTVTTHSNWKTLKE